MPEQKQTSDQKEPPVLVRWIDQVAVGLIKVFMYLAYLKSRDPRDHPANLLRPDPLQRIRIRNWQAIFEWPPQKRVGCFVGVLIGIAIGGAILWYGLKD